MSVTPKSFYGQHFLRDESVLAAIVEAAHLSPDDVVLEIGPGEGVLTQALLATGARVVAVEVDDEAMMALRERFANEGRVRLEHADIGRVPSEALGTWLTEAAPGAQPPSWKLVANIPYNISGALLRRFLMGEGESCVPQQAVLLLQKEVVDRALAGAGEMNMLALGLQLAGQGRRVRVVPPGAFFPPPAVQSAVFAWERGSASPALVAQVLAFAKPAFLLPRKKLRNTLGPLHGGTDAFAERCAQAGVSPEARPEELGVDTWKRLAML
jgi:16S rRNA (adenine1518-N6/adenine1519-N6)-dimethyltransferase